MPTGTPLTATQIQTFRNKAALHHAARQRVLLLEGKVKQLRQEKQQLKDENQDLQQQLKEAQEKIRQQEDTNKKLRTLLFKKQQGKLRTQRSKQAKPRTAASYTRPAPKQITEKKELVLEHCPECNTSVSDPISSRTRIIEDIIFHPKPAVVEWTIYRHWCTGCGKQVAGTIPGVLPKTRIGPQTLTFVVLAKYRWNQPYGKIQDQLKLCFGLHVSEGEIAKLIERSAELVKDKWVNIIKAVKAGQIVHCDETGWYINGQKVWAHTFANDYAVLYEISPSRGKQIAENQLAGFTGTRITDCLANYKNLSGSHQICWAHLTREAGENMKREPDNRERAYLSQELDAIYFNLRKATSRQPWNPRYARDTHIRVRKKLVGLRKHDWLDATCKRLINRLSDFDQALFTCLTASGIPPDNNHAERVLRKLVVQRKISGGNRSPTHAEYHAKNMSVLETLRLEQGELLTNLQTVLQQGMTAQLSGG